MKGLNRDIPVLVFASLLTLAIGRYFKSPFIFGNFYALNFFLPLLVVLILKTFVFKIHFADWGFRFPVFHKKWIVPFCLFVVLIPFGMFLLRYHPTYFHYYNEYRTPSFTLATHLKEFSAFIFSTLVSWEILLRGMLLFGLVKVLSSKLRIDQKNSELIAILWVCCFESLYHFQKPDVEAFGLMIASPFFSWIALRSKSFLPALALHLYIEFLFTIFVISQ